MYTSFFLFAVVTTAIYPFFSEAGCQNLCQKHDTVIFSQGTQSFHHSSIIKLKNLGPFFSHCILLSVFQRP